MSEPIFSVEWTPAKDVPVVDGEADFDFRQQQKNFSTYEAAVGFADKVLSEDFFGQVRIDRQIKEPLDCGDFIGYEWSTTDTWYHTGEPTDPWKDA